MLFYKDDDFIDVFDPYYVLYEEGDIDKPIRMQEPPYLCDNKDEFSFSPCLKDKKNLQD
ncbi:MAG: hypothetical protein QW303_06120 [Nitrososphaerota archaeon]